MRKTLFLTIAIVAAAATLQSCEDYLDKEPLLATTEKTIFSDKSKIEANLLGIYGSVKQQLAYKGRAYQDIRGEDVADLTQNVNECYTVYEMAVSLTSEDNSNTWAQLYLAINGANTFLDNLEKARDVAGNDYARYAAEAKFLRALCYYSLNTLYAPPYKLNPQASSVPLRLQAERSTGHNNLAPATTDAVFKQILDDLSDDNIASLPDEGGTVEGVTRASRAAAHILRQRVYMEEEKWQAAIDEGNAIHGYSLAGSVADVFTSHVNSEVIFTFPMADNNKGGAQYAQAYYYTTGNIFILDDSHGFLALPVYALAADRRVKDLIVEKDGKYLLNKYPDAQNFLDWVPQFRYAEVLLNQAESYANLGQYDQARQYLAQVRRRSIAADDDPLDLDHLTGDDLLTAIYNERRAEFVGEGLRALDIHRRAHDYVKRNGTFKPGGNGYTWPIPLTERSANHEIKD